MSHDAAPPASAVRHGAVDFLRRVLDPRAVFVFMLAYVVRIVYVLQIRHMPYFDVPLVDGPNYFRMATAIASGSLAGGHEVFWQPPLYSYFLALLFVTVGTRMEAIYAVQAAIGSLSCVLVYAIGRRLFGRAPPCAPAWSWRSMDLWSISTPSLSSRSCTSSWSWAAS